MAFCEANVWRIVAGALLLTFFGSYFVFLSPPADFPERSIVVIAPGASAPQVARELTEARVIRYAPLLEFLLRVRRGSTHIQAGAYLFQSPQNLFTIARRLVTGAYGLPLVRITFPEGETTREAATRVHDAFSNISESDFLAAARPREGYLFPDTYFFSPSADAASIIKEMRANFDTKIATLADEIRASRHSLSELIIMASLVEKEARVSVDRRVIAGILFNRLERGMPLQVDAVFGYIFNRDTYSPSFADLKVDSPYNTYTHAGLPPGPIANPGLDSLEAVLRPAETDYLYYLTGTDGLMRYAKTYSAHQSNQRKYLN